MFAVPLPVDAPHMLLAGLSLIVFSMQRRGAMKHWAMQSATVFLGGCCGALALWMAGVAVGASMLLQLACLAAIFGAGLLRRPTWIGLVLGVLCALAAAQPVARMPLLGVSVCAFAMNVARMAANSQRLPAVYFPLLAFAGSLSMLAGAASVAIPEAGVAGPLLMLAATVAGAFAFSWFATGRLHGGLGIFAALLYPITLIFEKRSAMPQAAEFALAFCVICSAIAFIGAAGRLVRMTHMAVAATAGLLAIAAISSAGASIDLGAAAIQCALAAGGGFAIRAMRPARDANAWIRNAARATVRAGRWVTQPAHVAALRGFAVATFAAIATLIGAALAAFAAMLKSPASTPAAGQPAYRVRPEEQPILMTDRARGVRPAKPGPVGRADRVAYPSALRRRNIIVPGEYVSVTATTRDSESA